MLLLCLYLNAVSYNKNEKDLENMYLFAPLKWNKGQKIWEPQINRQLSYSSANASFKSLIKKFGFNVKMFALQSTRVGGTIDLFDRKVPLNIIDKQGRWRSDLSKFRYARSRISSRVRYLQTLPSY